MTFKRQKFGRGGEAAAVKFLKKRGYRILKKNFRTAVGEIDIVAEHNKVVVFIEVKSRSGPEFGHPLTAVTPAKQRKIALTAKSFLAKHKVEGRDVRFDVVSVTGSPDAPDSWDVEVVEDAFRL